MKSANISISQSSLEVLAFKTVVTSQQEKWPENKIKTVKDAAELTKLDRAKIERMMRNGQLSYCYAVKIGGQYQGPKCVNIDDVWRMKEEEESGVIKPGRKSKRKTND